MNSMDFTFEKSGWESTLDLLREGDTLSSLRFLTLLEEEPEEVFEDALRQLLERRITLDVSDLPGSGETGELGARLRREAELAKAGKLPGGLEQDDPLRLYLDEIGALPGLDNRQALLTRCAAGDEEARGMLAAGCLPRVAELAMGLAGRGVLLLDLIQEGNLELWQSILSWQGEAFSSYCDWRISQAFARVLVAQARANGVGRKLTGDLERYRAADRRLLTRLGRNPTLEEIALELHMTPEDTSVLEDMLRAARIAAKAKAAREPREADPEDEQAVENTAYFQSRQRILDMLASLDESDAKLLTLRFGLEGGLPMNPQDAGKALGLTPEEVLSREAAALGKLRTGNGLPQ